MPTSASPFRFRVANPKTGGRTGRSPANTTLVATRSSPRCTFETSPSEGAQRGARRVRPGSAPCFPVDPKQRKEPFHSFAWRRRRPPRTPPNLRAGSFFRMEPPSRRPLRSAPLQRSPHSPAPPRGAGSASAQPPTSRRSRLTGGEGRALWRGLRVGSVPGWGALGGCVGGRISTPTVRAQARWPGACRFHEVSPAPSVMVGARCAGGVAGGQPRALPGPLDRREQRRARGGDGRRLALRQGSEGERTHRAHRRARVSRVQGGRHQAELCAHGRR